MAILTARDGLKLSLHLTRPAGAETRRGRATVVIVHGLGEHCGRYAHVIERLRLWGFGVAAYDQRGHGLSEGARGALAASDDLLHDLALVIDRAQRDMPGPVVLLGHSMGGLVAARFAAELTLAPTARAAWARSLDALVLSSPALDPGLSLLQRALLSVMPKLAPNLAVANGLRPQWISKDPAVVAAYVADEKVHDRITPRLGRFILDAGREALALAPRWRVPTLLMWGGADRCVAPQGSARFADAADPQFMTAHLFSSLSHEIFNEPQQDEVFKVLERWLDRG
jgi:alpha-beta hydrolase superfamily lysophospholipase